jgi:hypothetical protein
MAINTAKSVGSAIPILGSVISSNSASDARDAHLEKTKQLGDDLLKDLEKLVPPDEIPELLELNPETFAKYLSPKLLQSPLLKAALGQGSANELSKINKQIDKYQSEANSTGLLPLQKADLDNALGTLSRQRLGVSRSLAKRAGDTQGSNFLAELDAAEKSTDQQQQQYLNAAARGEEYRRQSQEKAIGLTRDVLNARDKYEQNQIDAENKTNLMDFDNRAKNEQQGIDADNRNVDLTNRTIASNQGIKNDNIDRKVARKDKILGIKTGNAKTKFEIGTGINNAGRDNALGDAAGEAAIGGAILETGATIASGGFSGAGNSLLTKLSGPTASVAKKRTYTEE